VLDRAEQTIFDILHTDRAGGFQRLGDIMPGDFRQIEAWCQSQHGVSGVASGFVDLDRMTRGFQPGNLVIIAARPAMGKSALVLNIAQHVATAGQTVGFFSLEMSNDELGIRTLTAEARVDGYRLQRGWVRESEWARLSAALGVLSDLPLYIDESPFVTVLDIRSRARRLKAVKGLALLVVDYTQLMIGHERKENRTLELAAITRALKALAKDLQIPVLALSQLNRDLERRENKRPLLSDLRDSGSLEQDADLVIFIYRDEVYHEHTVDKGVAELIISKQRNGPIGTVKLAWIPEETRFANLTAQQEPEDRRLPMGDR
jgi:replicative DNA helicase